jgi:transketolase
MVTLRTAMTRSAWRSAGPQQSTRFRPWPPSRRHQRQRTGRTTGGSYPGLCPEGEPFPVGGSNALRSSENDQVTLVGAGITLHECLRAAEMLAEDGIAARVIDCYSVKPIDAGTLAAAADATSGRLVIAEDRHLEGGLGSAVSDALLAS